MKIHPQICMQNQHAAQDPPFRLQFWRRDYCMDVAQLEVQHAIIRPKQWNIRESNSHTMYKTVLINNSYQL